MSGLATLRPLAKRFVLPVVLVLAGLLMGLGYGLLKTPEYKANAYVLVVKDQDQDQVAVSSATAYGRIAALPETLAWSRTPPPGSLDSARTHIQASTSPDSPLIQLSGSATTPRDAAAYANTAANALVRYGAQHTQATGVSTALMSSATEPLSPSSPNLRLNVAVGIAMGILLAGLSAAVRSGIRNQTRAQVTHQRLDEAAIDGWVPIRTANAKSMEVDR
jgi:capsular polysaccharide biosynthesis protein